MKRSTSYNKSNYKRKNSRTKTIVKYQVQQELKRVAEKKFYDENYNIANLSLAGNMEAIVEPGQGTQSDERVGDKITVTSLQMTVRLFSPGLATTAPYNTTRIIIFIWFPITTPTVADILQVNTINYAVLCPFNYFNRKNRKILYDKVVDQYYVNANNFAQDPSKTIDIYMPMNKKNRKNEIIFDPGTGAVTNQIYTLIISDNNGVANTQWSAYVATRVNFLDI